MLERSDISDKNNTNNQNPIKRRRRSQSPPFRKSSNLCKNDEFFAKRQQALWSRNDSHLNKSISQNNSYNSRNSRNPRNFPENHKSNRINGNHKHNNDEESRTRRWISQEDEFTLQQLYRGSILRIRNNRGKTIDFLATLVKLKDGVGRTNLDNEVFAHVASFFVPQPVYRFIDGLKVEELQELINKEIPKFVELEPVNGSKEVWENIVFYCKHRLESLMGLTAPEKRTVDDLREDIDRIINGKTLVELYELEGKVKANLRDENVVDKQFWRALASEIAVRISVEKMDEVLVRVIDSLVVEIWRQRSVGGVYEGIEGVKEEIIEGGIKKEVKDKRDKKDEREVKEEIKKEIKKEIIQQNQGVKTEMPGNLEKETVNVKLEEIDQKMDFSADPAASGISSVSATPSTSTLGTPTGNTTTTVFPPLKQEIPDISNPETPNSEPSSLQNNPQPSTPITIPSELLSTAISREPHRKNELIAEYQQFLESYRAENPAPKPDEQVISTPKVAKPTEQQDPFLTSAFHSIPLDENEIAFNSDENLSSILGPNYTQQSGRIKPRFFNRVKMGFEWNRYNQLHYDVDNPPPKVVQGYFFNIFYPLLENSPKAPTYRLIRGPKASGKLRHPVNGVDEDTCILLFSAPEPYQDIAFRIVDRPWNKGGRRDGTFKSKFENGVLQLHFRFQRLHYRK